MTPELAIYPRPATRFYSSDNRRRVERVIHAMRERFSEPFNLQEMADIANWSPFHFNRIFHEETGLPPVQFLSLLRLQAAKQLLLTTNLSVTDVCFEVGYNGLGTFIRRFTAAVGISPHRFRLLAHGTKLPGNVRLFAPKTAAFAMPRAEIKGQARANEPLAGLIFVGLFATPVPAAAPLSCAMLPAPGRFRLRAPADGSYYLYAAAFCALTDNHLAYLLPEEDFLRVGTGAERITVNGGQVQGLADISLRRLEMTDPPILTALPLLAAQQMTMQQAA
jgi:AraC-like DNA-binding protein